MRRAFARWAIARFERAVDLNLENIERALRDASPGGRLLDLGCDDGELTTRFADAARAGEIHCVELAQHRGARDGLAAVLARKRERQRPELGNPLAIHRAAAPDTRASWQHMKVFSYRGLRELFDSHGLVVHDVLGAGYYPLAASVGRVEPRHAAFLTIVAGR